eukprot:m.206329 g.206329  ORF g.206329 m.206329 type:complete len:75 (+) comp15536_c8_seq1:1958-2182(+)
MNFCLFFELRECFFPADFLSFEKCWCVFGVTFLSFSLVQVHGPYALKPLVHLIYHGFDLSSGRVLAMALERCVD